mgnify:CR=1 FL=1
MDIIIRGSKLEITEAMESYAKEKISRLEKYLENSDDTHATILVKIHGHLHIVEVTIPLKNFILRAEESKDDFYAAIDTVTDKLERQIRKNKTRIAAKKNKEVKDFAYDYIQSIEEESEEKIVKRKKIEVKPMDEEEAILQMELINHDFFGFKNVEEDCVSIVYKRKDGHYGIINLK